MKQSAIVALICVNAVLLLALVFQASDKPAYGQFAAASQYMMMTARVGNDEDALYILDLGSRALAAWRVERAGTKFTVVPAVNAAGVRDLSRDFGREH